MSESVCLQCGKEMPYDWAACPECGWKAPESWETPEEEEPSARPIVLSKFRSWTKTTAWIILAVFLAGFLMYLVR